MPSTHLDEIGPTLDHSLDTDPATHIRLLSSLMDLLECGVLACGPTGQLYHANASARRELAAAVRLRMVDGRVCASRGLQDIWCTALHDAVQRQRARLLCLDGDGGSLTVALVPVHVDGMAHSAVVAVLGRQLGCSPLGLEMLSSRHGLTYAEQRVMRALVGNFTSKEIAASHGVALSTVRTQIQSVRDKLGVRSIDALLLRAAELPPITSRY